MQNKFKDFIMFDSPDEMLDIIQMAGRCEHVLTKSFVNYCMEQYSSCYEDEELDKDEAKKYIIYALVCILNELRTIPEYEMDNYFYDPDELLSEVIDLAEFRGWSIDTELALGLCERIIICYLSECLPEVSEDYIEGPALEQIIDKLPEDTLEKIHDPVWENFMDKLKSGYDGDEYEVFVNNDIQRLQRLVRARQILPCDYSRM